MKLKDIQNFFIKEGINEDPRGVDVVFNSLKERKIYTETLKDNLFDCEYFTNPYCDSKIIYGDMGIDIKTVMVGIDIESQELLLAKHIIDNGIKIDLVIAHHPEAYAYSSLCSVIKMNIDILNKYGVPINIAEKIVNNNIDKIRTNIFSKNNDRIYDMAKLLNIPFMTAHTVADNHVSSFIKKKIDLLNPIYLKDVIELLNEIPEYKYARKNFQQPFILNGCCDSKCGKIFVDMTGGVEIPESFEKLADAGISTILTMCLSSKSIENAKKYCLNVIFAGHISSDTLGLNLLFDKLELSFEENLKFIECSGFRRFKRENDTR
jgi:putative NIF3 family GTP cyclohydrolase 1 type 2